MRDCYKILGVPHTASAAEIRRAYRQKAKILHPDLSHSDSEAFRQLVEAYETLSDAKARSLFDEKYKWSNDNCETFTKYCTNSRWGNVDNNLELLPEDDAATADWGSNWCTPSKDQVNELINSSYTTIEQATLNGVGGWKITSKKNGKTLFFPTAGERWYDGFLGNNDCCYWTRSVEEKGSIAAYIVRIDKWASVELRTRLEGVPIRPVRSSK